MLVGFGIPSLLAAGIAVPVLASEGYFPGDGVALAWQAHVEPSAPDHGNGSWLSGDVVVRVRFDAVTGFDAATGVRRWNYVTPGRGEICAVSGTADAGVGVIAYGEDETGCATASALDLATGRELWHAPLRTDGGGIAGRPRADLVAVAGGLVLLRDSDPNWGLSYADSDEVLPGSRALRALDARTGRPRWRARIPNGCVPYRAAAAAAQVAAVLSCAGGELRAAVFAPADGRARWSVPLGTKEDRLEGTESAVSLLSADPVVVQVRERAARGTHAYLAFGTDGRPLGRIDQEDGARQLVAYGPDSTARITVSAGRLFVAAAEASRGMWKPQRLAAFDLAAGRRLWEKEFDGGVVEGVHADGGRVTAVVNPSTRRARDDDLHVLDPATGRETDERAFREDVDDIAGLDVVYRHGELLIVVRHGDPLITSVHPVSAYRIR